MKHVSIRISLILFIVAALLIGSVYAGQEITAYPGNITIEGSRYDRPVRTLLLSADQNITGLQFISSDLESPKGTIFPSDLILATRLSSQMVNGSNQQVKILFDLSKAPDTGNFAGELWFSYPGETLKIPVAVTVKTGWVWPLVILLTGVLASLLLFTYESQGKKRDEIVKALGILDYRISKDKELKNTYDSQPNPFLPYLESSIKTILATIDAGETEKATTMLDATLKVWDKWNTMRPRWIHAFENFQSFRILLNTHETQILSDTFIPAKVKPSEIRFIREMRDLIRNEYDKIPETDKPDTFLGTLTTQIGKEDPHNRIYLTLHSLAQTCEGQQDTCPPCDLDALWISFLDSTLKDDLNDLAAKVNKRKEEIDQCGRKKALALPEEQLIPEKFAITGFEGPAGVQERSHWAQIRLWLYNVGSFLITLIILVGIGFSQLYIKNPTFGSIDDYATLALWGLLVGPFADALVKKVRKETIAVD